MSCRKCNQPKSSCGCQHKTPVKSESKGCKSCGKSSDHCKCWSKSSEKTRTKTCHSCKKSSDKCKCESSSSYDCGSCGRSWDDCGCSSSSDTCYIVKKCSSSCGEIDCKCPCPPCPPSEIFCKKGTAVVNIHASSILVPSGAPFVPGPTGTLLGAQYINKSGNGFFTVIKCEKKCKSKSKCGKKCECKDKYKRYVICPASLVTIPPTYLTNYNRYPFVSATQPAPNNLIPSAITQVSQILVDVFNVNNKDKSWTYVARLVGVDGAGDTAVLELLRPCGPSGLSCGAPKIKLCHPYLEFANICEAVEGETVYLIGSPWDDFVIPNSTPTSPVIVQGLLQDKRHLAYNGFLQPESLVVSALVSSGATGMPILNGQGCVLGMQTTGISVILPRISTGASILPFTALNQADGEGIVGGITEKFMRDVLKSLINSNNSSVGSCYNPCNTDCHRLLVTDAIGSFTRFVKGYAGIAWEVVVGDSWDVQIVNGVRALQVNPDGSLVGLPSGPSLIGIKVLAVAGGSNPSLNPLLPNPYVPGATNQPLIFDLPNDIVDSPFLAYLSPGDIITGIKNHRLGDLDCQTAPSNFTWHSCAGDSIQITYYKLSENYTITHCQDAILAQFPALMDQPWYAINRTPLIAPLAPGQLGNPMLPAFITSPITLGFRPAF